MRKLLSLASRNVGVLECLKVPVLVLAVVLAMGIPAQSEAGALRGSSVAASQPSNLQTSKPSNAKLTKWDAGEKDLLASMDAETAKSSKTNDEPVYITLLSFIFKLALVVVLAYGTIFALKRFNVSTFKRANVQSIRVLENTSLAANRSLHLVEVGSKRLLVASTPGQISLLTEIDKELSSEKPAVDSAEVTVDRVRPLPTLNTSFKQHLSTFMASQPLNIPTLGRSDAPVESAANVAQIIRGSSAFLQEKIMVVGRLRKELRDA